MGKIIGASRNWTIRPANDVAEHSQGCTDTTLNFLLRLALPGLYEDQPRSLSTWKRFSVGDSGGKHGWVACGGLQNKWLTIGGWLPGEE